MSILTLHGSIRLALHLGSMNLALRTKHMILPVVAAAEAFGSRQP